MEKILGLKSYCCSNGEISNFEKYEGLTFVLVFGGHRITAGRGTSSVSNVLLSITIGSPYHSLANTEKLSYLYNKTLRLYILVYLFIYLYVSYSRPNGWTKLSERNIIFFFKILNFLNVFLRFHGQRRALQLVINIFVKSEMII